MLCETVLFMVIFLVSYTFYKWVTINNDYFERRNIKYMKPRFLFGNTGGLFLNKYTVAEFAQKIYQSFDEPIFGMFDFRVPRFVVRDPEAIKQIGIKDFDYFEDRSNFIDEKADTLFGNSLILMKGERWRQMRASLSPAFTGSKMRQMFELVMECVDENVVKHLLQKAKNEERINIEMKELFSRHSNDVIASCAFGLKINSFTDPENEFYTKARPLLNFTSFKQMFRLLIASKLPAIARAFKINISGPFARLFKDTILDTMEVRKKNNIHRSDMINLMMQIREGTLKTQTDEKEKESDGFATVEESDVSKVVVQRSWNDDEIVAQCFVFFLAGLETSATLLTFASYELAINPGVQQKLYEEIVETNEKLSGKRINYETLQKMEYLDQVICETLRLWTPGAQNDRVCVKDYVYNHGGLNFSIEKGTPVIFTIYGIHHDPKYFPEPEKFKPDRFSDENKHNIIPGTFLPFGVGPRNCIGSRFALMEMKAILYYLLLNFSFEPNDKTEIPIKLQKNPLILNPKNGLHLELKPR